MVENIQRQMQTKIGKTSNIPQSQKQQMKGHHGKHERNNPMRFQLNNMYYRNTNVKSYT